MVQVITCNTSVTVNANLTRPCNKVKNYRVNFSFHTTYSTTVKCVLVAKIDIRINIPQGKVQTSFIPINSTLAV